MKKLLALLLVSIMALSLVACGDKAETKPTEEGVTITEEQKLIIDTVNAKLATEDFANWQSLYKEFTGNEATAPKVTNVTHYQNSDFDGENDLPIVPDVGMFASFDPVALDQACADAVNAQPVVENSLLGEREHVHGDHFKDVHPNTEWQVCLEHAEKMGIGTRRYELIKIK